MYETPEEITDREQTIDSHWATLDELSRDRRATLTKLKAREERKEALRIECVLHPLCCINATSHALVCRIV